MPADGEEIDNRPDETLWTSGGHWPDADDGPWALRLGWQVLEGRREFVGLAITPIPGAKLRPLTSTQLRSFPFRSVVDEARAEYLREVDRLRGNLPSVFELLQVEATSEQQDELARKLAGHSPFATPRPAGRPRLYDDEHFASVAAVYSAAWQRGENPTEAVRRHFDQSQSNAAKWVKRARGKGLLPETVRGQARGLSPESEQAEGDSE